MNIFRKLRKEKNLTQKQLADLLFLDQTTISKWELGKAIPDYGTLQKIADLYDVTIDLLLNRENHPLNWYMLTPEENELIIEYRKLVPSMQAFILDSVKKLNTAQKDESSDCKK